MTRSRSRRSAKRDADKSPVVAPGGPALTLDETADKLAELRQGLSEGFITKTRSGIESGAPDAFAIRRLLVEFVSRAPSIRKHIGSGYTASIVDFVASRLDEFVSDREPDLMRAFGSTLPRRGRKPSSKARRRQEIVAAEVLDLMNQGKTLDEACPIVAEARSLNESTVRNWYSRHKQTAANLLVYRYTLHPSFASGDESESP